MSRTFSILTLTKRSYMTLEDLQTTLYRLEKVMYGYNYEVTYGVDLFENCSTEEEFKARLKQSYPQSKPEGVPLIPLTADDFWEEINFGLIYRGDRSAGLQLDENGQKIFDELQRQYKDFIYQHIDHEAKLYSYPDDTGIPGYPVFWDYRLVIQSPFNRYLFIYASSSD